MKYTEKISNKLNELLEKNYDAEKGYLNSAENVESSNLKIFFKNRASERSQFAKELRTEIFPFSELARRNTNTLIFPNLSSGNIAYKLMQEMGDTEAIGPILLGMKKPVHILQLGSSVREIVNMVTIAVADVQTRK